MNVEIPRLAATVIYAPAYFLLCKGRGRNYQDNEFGYHPFSFSPSRVIDREIDYAVELLDVVFSGLAHGIPDDWLHGPRRYVAKHVRLAGSWDLHRSAASDPPRTPLR